MNINRKSDNKKLSYMEYIKTLKGTDKALKYHEDQEKGRSCPAERIKLKEKYRGKISNPKGKNGTTENYNERLLKNEW